MSFFSHKSLIKYQSSFIKLIQLSTLCSTMANKLTANVTESTKRSEHCFILIAFHLSVFFSSGTLNLKGCVIY